jgi:cysteine synthase A
MKVLRDPVKETLQAAGRLVGNTPLLGIRYRRHGRERVIFAKCEQFNLTGSIKDRMALHILKRAYARRSLRPGGVIAEATSGNTGIALAALGRLLGHAVRIYIPNWMSQERLQLIQGYGAELVKVSATEGGFQGCIRRAEEFALTRSDVFLPRQFSNEANVEAHETTTGPEIWAQLAMFGRRPDAFVAGVGTGGTVMGVGRSLRGRDPRVRIYPVEPRESPTLSTGKQVGHHRIQGISDEFIPAIVHLEELSPVVSVADGDAILMAQQLARRLGLSVGISSGCNLLAAVQVQEELGGDATVATVFPDDNRKYLSTDLLHTEVERADYLSPEIELTGLTASSRVCQVCVEHDPALPERRH